MTGVLGLGRHREWQRSVCDLWQPGRGLSSESLLVHTGEWWVCLVLGVPGPRGAHRGAPGHRWCPSTRCSHLLVNPCPFHPDLRSLLVLWPLLHLHILPQHEGGTWNLRTPGVGAPLGPHLWTLPSMHTVHLPLCAAVEAASPRHATSLGSALWSWLRP